MTESNVRRRFSLESKREAVQLVKSQGLSVAEAARRLDRCENLLRKWRQQFGEATGSATARTLQSK